MRVGRFPGKSAMPRMQFKLMIVLIGLVVLVSLVSGVLAERGIRGQERARVISSLTSQGKLVQELLVDVPFVQAQIPALDAVAHRGSELVGARVTLIDLKGAVLGDSDVAIEKLPGIENHARRSEVKAALAGKVGAATRLSRTVGRRLYYVAVPPTNEVDGVVRIALELPDFEQSVAQLRSELLRAGIFGVLAAVILSFFASAISLRPLAEIRRVVSLISQGDLRWRVRFSPGDELSEIGASINEMAEQLRARLAEADEERSRLAAVLAAMVEGVLVLDTKSEILLANPRFRELFDLESVDVEGLRALELVRSADLRTLLESADGTREPVSGEIVIRGTPSDYHLLVQAVGFPLDGARMGTVAVFHDVSELRQLERVRADFVANASHELRTPLTAIRGFAETLLHNEVKIEDQRKYLEIIERHSRRLSTLVEDLLDLSKSENRSEPLSSGRVDLVQLVQSVLRDCEAALAEKSLHADVSQQGEGLVCGDEQALEQVLTNLIDNAIKYTEASGRIELRVEDREGEVLLCVTDTGIGIPAQDLDRIFERFYRVDKARSRALGGTGLGLSIVKHLVQSMGGSVEVESTLGQGTSFRVRLPRWRETG